MSPLRNVCYFGFPFFNGATDEVKTVIWVATAGNGTFSFLLFKCQVVKGTICLTNKIKTFISLPPIHPDIYSHT